MQLRIACPKPLANEQDLAPGLEGRRAGLPQGFSSMEFLPRSVYIISSLPSNPFSRGVPQAPLYR